MPAPDAAPAPEAAPAAEPVPDLPPAPEAAPEPAAGFSATDDEAILKLKGENKSWAEIGEVVKGKDKNELRERYKELMAKNGGSAASAPATPSEAGTAAATTGGGESSGGWAKKEKGKGGKGKQKAEAAGVKEQGKKMEEGEGTALQTERPVIYFDEADGLSIEDVSRRYSCQAGRR